MKTLENKEVPTKIIKNTEEEQKTPQAISDNLIEINGKIYELDLSEDLPMAEICAELGAFDFLNDEPDLYSVDDLKERYV